jgi:hypothetical protein
MLNMSENTSNQKKCDLMRQEINIQGHLYIFKCYNWIHCV